MMFPSNGVDFCPLSIIACKKIGCLTDCINKMAV